MTGAALMSLFHVVIKCTLGRRCERQYTSHFKQEKKKVCEHPKNSTQKFALAETWHAPQTIAHLKNRHLCQF